MSADIVEVPCPGCGTVNRLPGAGDPAGGEVACVSCGEPIAFRPAPHGPPVVPRRPSGPNVSGTLLRVEDWDEPRAAADLVTCPECGHRFATKAASDAGRVILIVEDTEFFLHLATEVLSKRYRTVTARSVGEARHILATTPVDLVLLDLTLPDAEGTELLRSLPRTDIPVLIYTSRDETALLGTEWEILQALGARDVIHKGINIEDLLLRKVQELLERAPAAPLA